MAGADYAIRDLGTERVLTIKGAEYRTYYSERVVRMLIERKGLDRAPLYFPFKETRGRHFLEGCSATWSPVGRAISACWRSAAPSDTSSNT